jgi:ubiquinone biosynthesis protein
MVGKALMTIEGIGKELDPELDVLAEGRPYFLELLQKRYSPEEIGKDLLRGAERLMGVAHDVPFHLQEVLDDVRMGRLQIQTVEKEAAPTLDRLGRRVFSGMIVASLNVAGGLAIIAATMAKDWRYPAWAAGILFFCAIGMWTLHVGSDWFKAWWAKGRKR